MATRKSDRAHYVAVLMPPPLHPIIKSAYLKISIINSAKMVYNVPSEIKVSLLKSKRLYSLLLLSFEDLRLTKEKKL
jgi:hypothetical protein